MSALASSSTACGRPHRGANVQDTCVLHSFPNQDVIVEENGHIGHGAVLHGCVVRKDALVGMNAVVMDGAEVGPESIVAACAFVPAGSILRARSLVMGAPAKVSRTLGDEEVARKREGTATYHRVTERCLASQHEVDAQTHVAPQRPRLELPELRTLTRGLRAERPI